MSELSRPLRRWAAQLSLFAPELAEAVGQFLPRLALALGDWASELDARHGEPAGYDGLSRRGPIERLLTSEWLWALELPDEFLRRAAMQEQSFLAPAFRAPPKTRVCTVLFDTGPSQLGGPRLAQLALLVVLVERARAANATLSFGVLQAPGKVCGVDVDEVAVRRWLDARDRREGDASLLAAWNAQLPAVAHEGEKWLVGGARLASLEAASEWSRVQVDDVVAPNVDAVEVQVVPRGRGARRLTLELPAGPLRTRLLREPFERKKVQPAAPRTAGVPDGRLFAFSPHGALIFSLKSGELVVQPLGSRVGRAQRPERRPEANHGTTPIAAGFARHGGALLLSRSETSASGFLANGLARSRVSSGELKLIDRPAQLMQVGVESWGWLGVLDDAQTLWRFMPGDAAGGFVSVQKRVLAWTGGRLGAVVASCHDRGAPTVRLTRLGEDRQEKVLAELPRDGAAPPVFFGTPQDGVPVVAVRGRRDESSRETVWNVFVSGQVAQLLEPPEPEVVGVCCVRADEPALVFIAPTRWHLWSETRRPGQAPGGPRVLFTSDSPIKRATVDTALPRAAILTADGVITVIDLETGTRWLTRTPEATS